MNLRILISLAPIIAFMGLERLGFPSWVAITGGFIASAWVFVYARKDHLIGALTVFGFVIVAASAIVGLIWNSEKAYLASGPIADFAFVGIFLGSIVVRQPLAGGIARELIPAIASHVPSTAAVFVWLSVAWAVFNLLQGIVRTYLLMEMTPSEYLIWSRVISWPFSFALVGASAWFIYREADRLGAFDEPVPADDVLRDGSPA